MWVLPVTTTIWFSTTTTIWFSTSMAYGVTRTIASYGDERPALRGTGNYDGGPPRRSHAGHLGSS